MNKCFGFDCTVLTDYKNISNVTLIVIQLINILNSAESIGSYIFKLNITTNKVSGKILNLILTESKVGRTNFINSSKSFNNRIYKLCRCAGCVCYKNVLTCTYLCKEICKTCCILTDKSCVEGIYNLICRRNIAVHCVTCLPSKLFYTLNSTVCSDVNKCFGLHCAILTHYNEICNISFSTICTINKLYILGIFGSIILKLNLRADKIDSNILYLALGSVKFTSIKIVYSIKSFDNRIYKLCRCAGCVCYKNVLTCAYLCKKVAKACCSLTDKSCVEGIYHLVCGRNIAVHCVTCLPSKLFYTLNSTVCSDVNKCFGLHCAILTHYNEICNISFSTICTINKLYILGIFGSIILKLNLRADKIDSNILYLALGSVKFTSIKIVYSIKSFDNRIYKLCRCAGCVCYKNVLTCAYLCKKVAKACCSLTDKSCVEGIYHLVCGRNIAVHCVTCLPSKLFNVLNNTICTDMNKCFRFNSTILTHYNKVSNVTLILIHTINAFYIISIFSRFNKELYLRAHKFGSKSLYFIICLRKLVSLCIFYGIESFNNRIYKLCRCAGCVCYKNVLTCAYLCKEICKTCCILTDKSCVEGIYNLICRRNVAVHCITCLPNKLFNSCNLSIGVNVNQCFCLGCSVLAHYKKVNNVSIAALFFVNALNVFTACNCNITELTFLSNKSLCKSNDLCIVLRILVLIGSNRCFGGLGSLRCLRNIRSFFLGYQDFYCLDCISNRFFNIIGCVGCTGNVLHTANLIFCYRSKAVDKRSDILSVCFLLTCNNNLGNLTVFVNTNCQKNFVCISLFLKSYYVTDDLISLGNLVKSGYCRGGFFGKLLGSKRSVKNLSKGIINLLFLVCLDYRTGKHIYHAHKNRNYKTDAAENDNRH